MRFSSAAFAVRLLLLVVHASTTSCSATRIDVSTTTATRSATMKTTPMQRVVPNKEGTPSSSCGALRGACTDTSTSASSTDTVTEYADYLQLEQLLATQQPRTDAHDETLFIVQHQTFELWLKLLLHELHAIRDALLNECDTKVLSAVFPKLDRATVILQHLDHAWTVLQTMSPTGFGQFRHALGSASGMQSVQYREVLFVLGQREPSSTGGLASRLEEELTRPSLYDVVLVHLFRAVGGLVDSMPQNVDRRRRPRWRHSSAVVVAAWERVYENPTQHPLLYMLAEKLIAFDQLFRRWRSNHVVTVERMIGFKKGTGGTTGLKYLQGLLEHKFFPEIRTVRNELSTPTGTP